jgi:hypothetical protein
VDSGHQLTPDLDFAIDPDVYRAQDGSLHLAFAMDFVEDAPLGTGIVEARVSDDLTTLVNRPRLLARAQYDWQVYDPQRRLPWKTIAGVDWRTDTVRWHTLEAPVGGLVSPRGQDVYLYSGGCFFGYYAVGALVRAGDGRLVDVSGGGRDPVLAPSPADAFFAPGHACWFRTVEGVDYLAFHARFGATDAPRQMALARLTWTKEGLPHPVPAPVVEADEDPA